MDIGAVNTNYSSCDVDLVCRSCMKEDPVLVDLFNNMDDSLPLKTTLTLADIYMICTPVQVVKEDGLPQKLCESCIESLTSAYAFRTQSERNDVILRDLVKNQIEESKNVKIKQEPDVDIDFKQEDTEENLEEDNFVDETYSPEPEVKKKRKIKKIRIKNGPHACSECGKQFYKSSRLEKHMKVHVKVKKESHMCEVCKKTFLKISGLNRHMAIHDAESKPFECSQCFQRFKREGLLLRHKAVHTTGIDAQLLESKEAIAQSSYHCEDCSMVFESRHSLSSHMRIHKEKVKQKNFSCQVCDKKFSSKNPLNRHMKLHSEDKPHKCTICDKRYSRQDQLLDHINKHNGVKPNVCPFCTKAFSQLCNLKDHMRTHTGETPYLCSQCGKGFNNGSNLRQHMMRHTGLKPYSCHLCPKRFSTKGQMTCHVGTHSGAHPYVCDTCGHAFTKPNSLKKHKLIHLGVKPHECDVCSMRFSCKDHLKRHYRIHTGEKPYKCTYCERAFTQSNDLVKHTRSHIGDNIYKCTVCLESFRLLSELKNHYPMHYSKNGSDEQVTYEKSQGEESPQTSEDSKTLISFDKHLDKTVISQIVLSSDSLDYQNVETKNEPKDVLNEDIQSPDVQIYVVDASFSNTSLNKTM